MTDLDGSSRRLLPLLTGFRHGTRSHVTCRYRCGNACDKPVPNRTDNPTFAEVVQSAVSRRTVLKGAGAGALVVVAGPALTAAAGNARAPRHTDGYRQAVGAPLTFEPVERNFEDDLVTAAGYEYSVVIRWGDPVVAGAPAFDVDAQTPEAQAGQFGYNCDFIGVLPLGRGGRKALLVVNHEYTDEQLMFRGVEDPGETTPEQKMIAMMAHGISVVTIERDGDCGSWKPSRDRTRNRRITVATPMELSGPAAGSDYLVTGADPSGRAVLGTLNDCAGGITPWGTTLHGEENFNQYFGSGAAVAEDLREPRYSRYGIGVDEQLSDRRWEEVDPRFDVAAEPNEPNRHGWIVEVDPYDPSSTPRKHTALGRFKHEGATVQVAGDGRVVAYMGDDERFDYVYKFVSRNRFQPGGSAAARRHNMTLLEEGDLYVARFTGDSPATVIDGSGTLPPDGEFDGTGRWIPLVRNGRSMIPGKSVAWVLTFTRLAADRLGKELDADGDFPDPENPVVLVPSEVPTQMDRPEDIQPNPVNGRVYAAMTNNSARTGTDGAAGADEANPLTRSYAFVPVDDENPEATFGEQPGNRNGHVIEWVETDGIAGDDFYWRVFILAGDPTTPGTYFAGYDEEQVSAMSCPDNLEFDPAGNLWISTDGNVLSIVNEQSGTVGGANDGLFAVPTAGPERGHLKAFLTVPVGAECSGPLITEDARSVFVSVQHPGETDGSTLESPSSTWPDKAPGGFPRPSVAVVFRQDGGRVGS